MGLLMGSGLLPMFGARAAYTWTGATWALAGGRAYNTPTLGSELLTDGGLEIWASATNLTNWDETTAGTSTVNREAIDIFAGTYALRMDVSAGGDLVQVAQHVATSAGIWYQSSVYSKADADTSFVVGLAGTSERFIPTSTTYAHKFSSHRATGAHYYLLGRVSGMSSGRTIYCDNASLRPITLSTMISSVVGIAGQTVTAKPYVISGRTVAGVISHLDSTSSPANFIIAYHDGGTSIRMDKCVGGTYTSLVSATTGFVSDAVIEIRALGSNQFECWYNGTKRGLTQTISDAGIISNTRHGLFSTYSSNLFSDGLTLDGVLIPFGF